MKRTVIAVLLLILTIGLSLISHFSTDKRIDEIIKILEEDRKITIENEKSDSDRARHITDTWKRSEKFLVATLAHGELEQVEIGIMCLNDYMMQGYTEEYIKTLNECINQLYHIKETEKVDIKNVF